MATEDYKDRNPGHVSVAGAEVAKKGFVESLLRHGTADRYYFLCDRPERLDDLKGQLAFYPNLERTEIVLLDEFERLRQVERMVMFYPDPALHLSVALRAYKGNRTWPVTGLTHSISGGPGFWLLFQTICESLYSYDCLVYTSVAGRRAVEKILEQLAEGSNRKYGRSALPEMPMPIIPLGTDTQVFQPRDGAGARERCGLPPGAVIFLHLGRFSTRYKMDLFPLVLAYSQLPAERRAGTLLVLAGDDVQQNLAPRLTAFAAQLGIAEQVVVKPNPKSAEKLDLYNAADVFVTPSDSVQETFGLTVVEAMACGLPVIASDWDGYRDTVEHGQTGFLVPTYLADCVEHLRQTPFLRDPMEVYHQLGQAAGLDLRQLKHYMGLLAGDAELRRRMGEAARRRVLAHFDWPVVIGQHEALWAELLQRAQASPEAKAHDDLSFDFLGVFSHYATDLLDGRSRVRLSDLGASLARGEASLGLFEQTELAADPAAYGRLVEALGGERESELAPLLGKVWGEAGVAPAGAFRQVARLIKYGILETC